MTNVEVSVVVPVMSVVSVMATLENRQLFDLESRFLCSHTWWFRVPR